MISQTSPNMVISSNVFWPLDHPRTWRTYQGGRRLDTLHGLTSSDGQHPEEWVLSTVEARNPGRPAEGLSRLADGATLKTRLEQAPSLYLGERHAQRCGA